MLQRRTMMLHRSGIWDSLAYLLNGNILFNTFPAIDDAPFPKHMLVSSSKSLLGLSDRLFTPDDAQKLSLSLV